MLSDKKYNDEGVSQLFLQWEVDRVFVFDNQSPGGIGYWTEAPHVTDNRSEAKMREREMVQEMLRDRKTGAVFREKMGEFEEKIRDSQFYLSALGKRYVESTGEEKEWVAWAMERERERLSQHKKELKRFEMYYQQCFGRIRIEKRMLDVETAKMVPIGTLIQAKPEYNAQGTSKYKCPLHNEKSASFVWYKKNNTWYCFGCGKGGDNISLYQQLWKSDFVSAVSELLRMV